MLHLTGHLWKVQGEIKQENLQDWNRLGSERSCEMETKGLDFVNRLQVQDWEV